MKKKLVMGTVRIVAYQPNNQGMVSAYQTSICGTRTACKRNGDDYIKELESAGYIIVHHHMEYKDVEADEVE